MSVDLRLDHPVLFWLLLAALLPTLLRFGGRAYYSRWRRACLLGLRIAASLALSLVAGGARLYHGGTPEVVALLDRTASMGEEGAAKAAGMAEETGSLLADQAAFTVMEFGGSGPDAGMSTNLELALKRVAAAFSPGGENILLLLSDGQETGGRAWRALPRLKERGIRVAAREYGGRGQAGPVVKSLTAPERVFPGQMMEIRAVLSAAGTGPVEVTLLADGEAVERRRETLAAGAPAELIFRRQAPAAGSHVYRVEARQAGAGAPAAGREARVEVAGKISVGLVAEDFQTSAWLAGTLRGLGMRVDEYTPQEASLYWAKLSEAEVLVLDNVPADSLGVDLMERMEELVREGGKGLLAVGGRKGLGSGRYRDTALEKCLPVVMGSRGGEPDRDIGLVVVLDTSLSMHFRGAGQSFGEAPRKIDIAKQALAEVIRAMRPGDSIGLMETDETIRWLHPLGAVADKEALVARVNRIVAVGGGINFYSSVREAYEAHRAGRASIRHIIVICDSNDVDQYEVTGQGRSFDIIRQGEEQGVTLSVFAVGYPSDKDLNFLRTAAYLGGGSFYQIADAVYLPRYFVSDFKSAAEAWHREEDFQPLVRQYTGLLAGMSDKDLPALGGTSLTTPKEGATEIMVAPFGAPLVATWRYGRGRTAVFASDSGGRWSSRWRGWPQAPFFWGRLVLSVSPRAPRPELEARAEAEGDSGVRLRVQRADGGYPGEGTAARLVFEEEGIPETGLTRTGLDSFAGVRPALPQGSHRLKVRLDREGEGALAVASRLEVPGPAELEPAASAGDTLDLLVRETGGSWVENAGDVLKLVPPSSPPPPGLVFWLCLGALLAMLGELVLRY